MGQGWCMTLPTVRAARCARRSGRVALLSLRRLDLDLRRLRALARPRLVEFDAPLALGRLHQRELCAERAPAAPAEAGDRPLRPARRDQLARDGHGELLARLALPDHEAAPGVVAVPAGVALAVLDDLVPADGARPERCARDAHVLERLVEDLDRLLREARDVRHEQLARVLAAFDPSEPLLPRAGQVR